MINILRDKKILKIAFVTNLPSHYVSKLFEMIAANYQTNFLFFSDASERWIEKKNPLIIGNYNGIFIKGIKITKHIRVNIRLLLNLLKENYNIFIQYINGPVEILITFIISKLLNKPFILWTDLCFQPETLFHKISFPFIKFIYLKSDAIVVWGSHVSNYLISLGVEKNKIFFSCGVVENSLFNGKIPKYVKNKILKNYNLFEKKIILYVGRLVEEKGLIYLLEAYKEINSNFKIALMIIGEGNQKKYLLDFVKKHNLSDVHFIGYVPNDELYHFYSLADIFVLPSIKTKTFQEPWGLVINEAMNQGCPVITTNIVGAAISGLVVNEQNGFIVQEKNSDALKKAISFLLLNTSKLKEMGNDSLNKIKDWNYDKAFEGFYKAIQFVAKS
ncbi:MAG: glycosyltransferase family 4 protein [Candidatus Thorarchaeota archaeon]